MEAFLKGAFIFFISINIVFKLINYVSKSLCKNINLQKLNNMDIHFVVKLVKH